MYIDSLMLSCMISELKWRNIITVYILGTFMQADMDELVHVNFEVNNGQYAC